MAKGQYTKRYGRVFAQLHFNTCKEMGLKLDKERWYDHVTKSAEKSRKIKVTLLMYQRVQTDRTVLTIQRTSQYFITDQELVY
jgi:hypothetical protein